jgi:methionyl-tRNA formyltransferase
MRADAPRLLPGVVLLAAQTARSQAYIQTLVAAGLLPERVVAMGPVEAPVSRPMPRRDTWSGILLPDLDEPIASTCERAGVAVQHVPDSDVNGAAMHEAISAMSPDIVIFSGVGGQIVAAQTLRLGPRFLHMHAGWLPQYRGSTTMYYALLEGEQPAVSAIILEQEIDTGPVLARKHYPRPPGHMDLDRVYDAAIRADLLARVLGDYAQSGVLAPAAVSGQPRFAPYYVIHPVLKHLSRLSLDGAKRP